MKRTFLDKMLSFCIMGLVCSTANAQLPNYQLNRILEEDGLRTSDVINMAKDKKGFMWIASQSYIHCFDGRHTMSFPFAETINKIVIDAHDRKWALTRDGIFLFDNSTRGFKRIELPANNRANTNTLYETKDGAVYISGNHERYIFDDRVQQFVLHKPLSPPLENITRYFGMHGQSLFFGRGDSVFRYNQQTKNVTAIRIKQLYGVVPLNDSVSLVSTTRFKTFHVNFNTRDSVQLRLDAAAGTDDNFVVHDGQILETGEYLLCTTKGLFQYNLSTRFLTQPVFYYNGSPLENKQSVTSLYGDNDGNIFMNHADGIFFLSNSSNFIQYIRNYQFNGVRLRNNNVRNFAEDKSGNVWLATTNGVAQLNMKTGELKSFDPLNRSSFIDFPSYRQLLYHANNLWIGTSGDGVWYYDERTGIFKRPSFDVEGDQRRRSMFEQAYVWKILALANGSILIVAGNGMYGINPATLSAKKLNVANDPGISRAALQDSSGRIWHGTTLGLTCMDSSFRLLFRVRDSFPDKRVASFCEWKKNNMLIGSKGLFEIQVQDDKIILFKRKNAIAPERLIYCMKQDKLGFVWLGTDDGMFRYDPVKDEAILFDRSDHVQSQAFNSDAAFISSAGLLFMGGKNGINYFNPAAFTPALEKLQPLITSFAVNINDSVYYTPGYKIPYNSRNIDFIISAPELKKPFRLQYRYKLRHGDQWNYTGFNNHMRISRLQPGDYALQVSASYDGKAWFDGEESASFTVLKPWWQTWWFRALCVITAAFIIWTYRQYQRRKKAAAEMKRKAESELMVLNSKIMESKFINLRLQMNPHFLFNILTSIQYLIVSNQVTKAMKYLDIFSGFLRSLLNHAEETVVTLDEELRVLNMYVELESLCLDETFVKEINVADEVDCEDVLVP
ncbi:MAG TPA: two-component regulator propeller domain-containing protein, partial [Chitinophagaceae bacterium]